MKTYTLSFADSLKHIPAHPEKTAWKTSDFDRRFQEWPSRAAMLKSIDMQSKRASKSTDWHEWKPSRHSTEWMKLQSTKPEKIESILVGIEEVRGQS